MKVPRDIAGADLAVLLKRYGYQVTRQKGSHIRLTSYYPREHHITIPNHRPIKIGTLSDILAQIAQNLNLTKEQLMHDLFG